MRLAAILLLTIFCMHYLPDILALNYADQTAAGKAWQYVMRGFGGAVLMCLLGVLARNPVVWACAFWGMVESSEEAICRLAHPIGGEPPVAHQFSGLCGPDFYWLGIIAALILAVAILEKIRGRDGHQR